MLVTLHHLDLNLPRGNVEGCCACAVEVMRLEGPLGAVESVVGVHPGGEGRIGAMVGGSHRDSSAGEFAGCISDADAQTSHRDQVLALADIKAVLLAAKNFLHPQACVAFAIGNERDEAAIRREARGSCVELAVRKRNRAAARRRHGPELMPLAPAVRAVDDALSVARPVRPRLPGGFLGMNLARLGAGCGAHPPDASAAVQVIAIRDENNFFAIGRPGRADLRIERAVVIARERAARLPGNSLRICERAACPLRDKNVEALVVRR